MRRKVEVIAALVVLVLVLLFAGAVRADEADVVVLKTGMVLKGRILERDERGLRMAVIGLGKMVVPLDTIRTINGEDPTAAPEPEPEPEPEPAKPEPEPEPEPGTTEPDPEPTPEPKRPVSEIDVPYEELKKGMKLLFLLAGEDHGEWVDSGRRVIAEVGLVGKRRFKIVTDPLAGVLGEEWVKKEDLARAVRLGDQPERRLLFFSEGVETGSWIRGGTVLGDEFEGELGGVTKEGRITILEPVEDRVEKTEISLLELTWLQAIMRSRALQERLESLAPGEPVEIRVAGREEQIRGQVVRVDEQWITVRTGDPREGPTGETYLYRGRPVTGLSTLPDALREGFKDTAKDAWLTIFVRTEDEETVTTSRVTGQLVCASLAEIVLTTADGATAISVGTVLSVKVPVTEHIPVLTARKDASDSESVLPVLPGMTREEVEKRIPAGVKGVDLLYEEGRVSTVYLRPPFPGPVFGIRFDDTLEKALSRTDLVFDTQIDPKKPDGEPVVTMVSRTLKPYLVKLLVSKSGAILAAEITAR